MKKSFFRVSVLSLATAVVLGMTACGGGGGSGGGATSTTSSSGSSSKGPFKQGSTVVAYKLDSNGSRDINVTTTTTDNKGTFSFSSLPWSGPTEFVIYGDYLNENTGSYMTLPSSSAISAVSNVTAGSSASVNINVLTNIAAKSIIAKMAAGTDINTAKTEAETSVKKLFNLDLGAGVSLDDLDPTDASTNTKANTQLLLVSSAILNTTNPEQVMQTLADDMSDGTVDDTAVAALDEVKTQAASVNLQQVAANMEQADIGVTNPPDNLESTLAGLLAVDNNISFTPQYDAFVNTPYVSNEVIVDSIYGGSGAIAVNNGEYSINGAPWTSTAGTVANGQKVRVRVTSASAYSTPATATLTIGGAQKPFSVITQDDPFVPDTSPNDFSFGYVANKSNTATNITSTAVTITGINTATPISVVGGSYKINNGSFVTSGATVNNDDNVTVRGDANTTGGGLTTVMLTVGDKTGTFKIFTAPDDTTPDAFSFADAVDVNTSTLVTSASITLSGMNTSAPISIEGGEYTTDGTTWKTTAGTVAKTGTVKVRATSANTYATTKEVKLTIGNVVGTFNITTMPDPFVPDTTPNALPTLVLVDQNRSATVTTPPFTISGINTPTPATIVGGTFDINGSGSYTDANVSNGDIITVTQTTAGSFNTTTTTTLTVGSVTGTLKTTTIVEDAIPNTFSFDTNASVSVGATNVTSNSVTISGINTQLPITVSNGEYDINGTGFTTAAGTVSNGDIVTLRQPTVATSAETPNITTVTIGNIATTFTTVTLPAAPAINNTAAAPTIVNEDALYTFTPELNATSGSVDNWSITNKPAWATFNTVNGKLEGTPRNANVGTDANISITATNSQGSSTYGPFTITVLNTNDAPTAADVNATTSEDTPATIDVSSAINDVDVGDSVSLTVLGTPSLGTVSKSGNIITYTPLLNANGLDSFTYTVADINGSTATATVHVTITPVNDAPVAQNDAASTNEDTNLTIQFATLLANDSDVDSNITVTAVTGGTNGTASLSGTDVVYTPNANFNGTDTITYTVSDGSLTADANVTITVLPVNDPATISGTLSGNVGEDTTLSATGAVTVTDNDTNETTVIPQTAVAGTYGSFSVDANGSWAYTLDNNSTSVQALIAGQNVTDSFNVTSLDGTAIQAVTITIAGTDDTAVFDSNSTFVGNAIEDTTMSVSGTVTVHDNDANQSFISAMPDTNVTYGTFNITQNGNWTYTVTDSSTIQALAAGETISELINVSSIDGSATKDINITITGTNDAPVAVSNDLNLSVKVNNQIAGTIHANDVDNAAVLTYSNATVTSGSVSMDANGSFIFTAPATAPQTVTLTFTVTDDQNVSDTGTQAINVVLSDPPVAYADSATTAEDNNVTINLTANDTDDNNATLKIISVTSPADGNVSIDSNSSVTYSPAKDFYGTDTFSYTITDPDGGTSTADVNITVTAVNDAPVAVDDNITTAEDTNATWDVLANDHDVDSNITVTAVTQGVNGSVSFDANGTVLYAPNTNFNGQDSFIYTVSDGSIDVNATVHVTVTAVNDAPVIAAISDITVQEDSSTYVMDINVTDIDNNLSTGLVIGALSSDPSTAAIINDANGTIEITPQANANGAVTITLNASDGVNNTTASFMFTITAVNDAPTAVDDNVPALLDTTLVGIDVLGNDFDIDDNNTNVNLTITSCDTNTTQGGSVTFDASSVTAYTPASGFIGLDTFQCTISDEFNATATEIIHVNVSGNHAPVANGTAITMTTGETIVGHIDAYDPDVNDTLTFTAVDVSPEVYGSGTTLTADGNFSITAYQVGQGYIDVNITDTGNGDVNATLTTTVRYNISVVTRPSTTDTYDLSGAGGSITSTEFDTYVGGSHPAMPTNKLYGFYGLENNGTVLSEDFITFDANGTFEMLDQNQTQYGSHDQNWTGVMQVSMSDPATVGFDANNVMAQAIMLDTNVSATEIASALPLVANLQMPASAVVYKTAVRMMQDQYYIDRPAEDCTNGSCIAYGSLSSMIDNNATGIVGYNRVNDKRLFVFAPDSNLSDGNGTIVEVDMTDVYAGNASEPFVINPNAGTWSTANSYTDENNASIPMVTITYANGVESWDKYGILIDAGAVINGTATSSVMKGSLDPAGSSSIEYRFNDVAAAVIKNTFNGVTAQEWITNVQDSNLTQDLNLSAYTAASGILDPSGAVVHELRINSTPTGFEFQTTDINFDSSGALYINDFINGQADTNESYVYSVTNNEVTINDGTQDVYKLKITNEYNATTITQMTGVAMPEGAVLYKMAGLNLVNDFYPWTDQNGNPYIAEVYDANGSVADSNFTSLSAMVDAAQLANQRAFMVQLDANTSYAYGFDQNSSSGSGTLSEINLDTNATVNAGTWAIAQVDINGTQVGVLEINATTGFGPNAYVVDPTTGVVIGGNLEYANTGSESLDANDIAAEVFMDNFVNQGVVSGSGSSPLAGIWTIGSTNADFDYLVLLPNGEFMLGEYDSTVSEPANGLEAGTYSYDGTNVTFNLTYDKNAPGSNSGIGDVGTPVTMPAAVSTDGTTLTATAPDGTPLTFTKADTSASPNLGVWTVGSVSNISNGFQYLVLLANGEFMYGEYDIAAPNDENNQNGLEAGVYNYDTSNIYFTLYYDENHDTSTTAYDSGLNTLSNNTTPSFPATFLADGVTLDVNGGDSNAANGGFSMTKAY